MLGTASDETIAAQLNIHAAVALRRRGQMGIAPFRVRPAAVMWTAEADALLGKVTDATIAARLGASTSSVTLRRQHFGIPAFRPRVVWTADMEALLGTAADVTIAVQLHIDRDAVTLRRQNLAIPAFTKAPLTWTSEMEALLGTDTDAAIAKKLEVTRGRVTFRRQKLGIAAIRPPTAPLKKIVSKAVLLPHPAEMPIAPTERHFDVNQPQFRMAGGTFPDTEDQELTVYLTQELADMYSQSLHPIACPYCRSRRTLLGGRPHASMSIPRFRCMTCKRTFNRLTGTPLARLRNSTLMPAYIRLLSQQIPYEEACKRLGLDYSSIANWTKRFRKWLLQLDPTGKWEAKVRLGIKASPHIRCPRCGVDGEKRFMGIDPVSGRKLHCLSCDTTFIAYQAECLAQQRVRMTVKYDPGKVNLDSKAGNGRC